MGKDLVDALMQINRSIMAATVAAPVFVWPLTIMALPSCSGRPFLWNAAEERLCDLLIEEDETLLRRLGAMEPRSPSAPPRPSARLLR